MPQKSSIPPALRRADGYLTTNAAQRRQRAREKTLPAFCAPYNLVQKRQRITPGRRFGLDVWALRLQRPEVRPPGRSRQYPFGCCLFYFVYNFTGCCEGGFEQLQRRPPPAAEAGSRSRGRGRRGQAPPKGAQPDAGTATRTVPAVLRPGGQKSPCGAFLGCGSANPPVGSGQCFLGTALFCLITKTAVPAAVTMAGAPGARNIKSYSPAQTRIGRYLYRAISSLPARAPCRKCEWPPVTAVRGILQGARSLRPGRRCWHCARRS